MTKIKLQPMIWAAVLLLTVLISGCGGVEPQAAASPAVPEVTVQNTGDPINGLLVFNDHCFICHSTQEGQAIAGPSLFGAGARYSDEFVRQSIQEPHQILTYVENPQFEDIEMPQGIAAELSDQEFEDVIAYLLGQLEESGK